MKASAARATAPLAAPTVVVRAVAAPAKAAETVVARAVAGDLLVVSVTAAVARR